MRGIAGEKFEVAQYVTLANDGKFYLTKPGERSDGKAIEPIAKGQMCEDSASTGNFRPVI